MRSSAQYITAISLLFAFCGLHAQTDETRARSGSQWKADDVPVIWPLPVNSPGNDFSPMLVWPDRLYFTSDRVNTKAYEAGVASNENVYLTKKTGDSAWSAPQKTYFLNSDDHTSLAGVQRDFLKLYLYRTFGNGDLYASAEKNGYWTTPKRLKEPVNSGFHEQSVSEANDVMVIASNRPGGFGEYDIFWTDKKDGDNYIDFQPLETVNSEFDELDVKLSADGKYLYFSSDRPEGQGGYDIYRSTRDTSGQWLPPESFKPPLNTEHNDRWFHDYDKGFFLSSDRPGGKGDDDLYWGYFLPKARQLVVKPLLIVKSDTTRVEITIVKRNVITRSDTARYLITVLNIPGGSESDTISIEELPRKAGQGSSLQGILGLHIPDHIASDTINLKITQIELQGEGGSDTAILKSTEVRLPSENLRDTIVKVIFAYTEPEVKHDTVVRRVLKIGPDGRVRSDTTSIEVVRVVPVVATKRDTAFAELTIEKHIKTGKGDKKNQNEGKSGFYARVQVGVYSNFTIEGFRKKHPGLARENLMIETAVNAEGKELQKFLIDKKFYSLAEAEAVQKEMVEIHQISDAFIPVYNERNERIAIYNPNARQFVLLSGTVAPDPF